MRSDRVFWPATVAYLIVVAVVVVALENLLGGWGSYVAAAVFIVIASVAYRRWGTGGA